MVETLLEHGADVNARGCVSIVCGGGVGITFYLRFYLNSFDDDHDVVVVGVAVGVVAAAGVVDVLFGFFLSIAVL